MVMACHFGEPTGATFTSFGHNGVTVFFTLSGFLITALLLEERDRTGRVALLAFYARRGRRLLPALYVFVAVALVAGAVFGPSIATPRDAALACLYIGNWSMAGRHYLGALGHTWSLAVEEQFYALWPLVLIAVLRRRSERTLFAVAVTGAVVSIGLRVFLWFHTNPDRVYFGSETHADALLIGCCVAIAMRRSMPRSVPAVVPYVLIGLVLELGFTADEPTRFVILPTFVAILTAGLVAAMTCGESRVFTSRALGWVGRRSYGLYLWHVLILACMRALGASWLLAAVITLVVTPVIAELSWRYVERPCLRRRGATRAPSVGAVQPLQQQPDQALVLSR